MVIERAEFGASITIENLSITIGSYNARKGLFIVASWSSEGEKHVAKVGRYFEGFEVITVTNSSVTLKRGITTIEVPKDKLILYGRYGIRYSNGTIFLYKLPSVEVKKKEERELVVFYPYSEVTTEVNRSIMLPLTIFNNGTETVNVTFSVVNAPKDWDVKFYYQGIEIKKLKLREKESITLQLKVLPSSAGSHVVKFSINGDIYSFYVNVVQPKMEALKITAPILVQEAEAGSKVTFSVLLSAGEDSVISMDVREPRDWKACILVDGVRAQEIYLRRGETKVVNLILEIPRNASLGYYESKISFTVRKSNGEVIKNETITLGVNIYKTYKGQKATLKLILVDDTGSPVPKALVKVGNESYATDSTGTLEVEMNPGKYVITIEKEGYETKKEEVELGDGEKKELKLLLVREPYYFNVEAQSDIYPIVMEGLSRPFTIVIENLGKSDDEYKLEIRGIPENWNAFFTESAEGNIEVTKVKVKSGETKTVYLKVYPSLNAMPGTYNATITVISSSGIKKEIPVKIKLIGSYNMNVNLLNYRLTITAGEEKTAMMDIFNFGNAPLTNLKITVKGPQGWDVKVDPSQIPSLSPKGRERVTITVKVPEGTPAGDYRVQITVKADQAEWQDTLRVVVRQRSTSTYIGVLILIISFALVLFMMRRIGRR